MSRERIDLRRWSGGIRREFAGKEIVRAMSPPEAEAAGDRPEWLPEDWTMELKKRNEHCLSRNRIDRYYICPLSGKKLRSRLEVMRFLNNETLDRAARHRPAKHRPAMCRPATSSLAVVGERPEWLPAGWSVEFRKRGSSNTIDKYYICPLSGKKLRSRLEVMRFLNNEMLDYHASGSAPLDEDYKQLCYIEAIDGCGFGYKRDVSCYLQDQEICQIAYRKNRAHTPDAYSLKDEFLPIIAYKKSKVKRTVVRRRLFAGEGPISNASMDVMFANHHQKPVSSPLVHFSAHLDDGASEISCSTLANEHAEQRIRMYQIEWQPNLAFHEEVLQQQPVIKMPRDPGNEKLSLMQLKDERQPVPDDTLSEEKQLELTTNQSQHKRHSIEEKLQEHAASKILLEPDNEKLSEQLMQLEGERLSVPDANLSEEKQFELTKKIQPKRCSIGEEIQEQSAIKIIQEPVNEKLSEPLMQLEGERLPVPDANLPEEKQFELTQKQSRSKRCGIGEELQVQTGIVVLPEPRSDKVHLEGRRLPTPDALLSEEKQFELAEKPRQLKRCSQHNRRSDGEELQGQLEIKILPEPENEMLSVSLIQLEGETLQVPDANSSELTEKLSQCERCRRGCQRGSRNTESVRSVTNQPRLRKRKAEKTETEPVQTSKWLSGVTAASTSNSRTGNQCRRGKARKIGPAQSTVPKESDASCWLHQKDVSRTDELQEKLKSLKPFVEQAFQEYQADLLPSAVIKDTDASCWSQQEDTHVTNEIREKLERLKPFVEQASQNHPQPTIPEGSDSICRLRQKDSPETDELQEKFRRLEPFVEQAPEEQSAHPLATLPFGDSWVDPCLEFAFKTLTGDFPVLEEVAAIQDYFSNHLISSQSSNPNAEPIPLACDAPSNGKLTETLVHPARLQRKTT